MVTVFEVLSILKQVGLALAGASCLWGIYFYWRQRGESGDEKEVFMETSREMMSPLTLGVFLTTLSWIGIDGFFSYSVMAHEGITMVPSLAASEQAFVVLSPVFFLFVLGYLGIVWYWRQHMQEVGDEIVWFYAFLFSLAAVLISFPVWEGSFSSEQIFFMGHGFHSVLTVGTVLILDFLFLLTKRSDIHEQVIYPTFHDVSKGVWLGLAIEFVSVYFIFHNVVANTAKFRFMQTVIGIIIVNGVFLSGPVVEKLVESVRDKSIDVVRPMDNLLLSLSGSVSVASWLTVTVVDLIKDVGLGYGSLMLLYVGFVLFVFLVSQKLKHHHVGSRW